MCLSLTCGRVDACSDVEVAEGVGMGHVDGAPPVAAVTALMVRQAASHGGLRNIAITVPRFL